MGRPGACIVSYRLGGGDGVSNEASKWAQALSALGFEVTTVAGEGVADQILPGLAIDADSSPTKAEVEGAIEGAELVVVENLCSLPLNPAAGAVVAESLRGRRALMHHHDLPWQRQRFAHCPPPPDDAAWLHVTINQISRQQLAAYQIAALVVRNTFDVDVLAGDRSATRQSIEVRDDELVVLQPTRAIPRKNIAGAIALCEAIGATYWLLGPTEDGFDAQLEQILGSASCRVIHGHAPGFDPSAMTDVYAGCDLVTLPSTWEGFGNPALESAIHRKPLAIGHYPVAAELASFGFRWFAYDDHCRLNEWFAEAATDNAAQLLDHNLSVATRHFAVSSLPSRLERVFESAGWASW